MWGLLLLLLRWLGVSPIPFMAGQIGCTEAALNLLFSIVSAYPTAIIYDNFVRKFRDFRNTYFILIGLDMAWFNFGTSFIHNMIPIFFMYLTNMTLHPGPHHTIVTLVFNIMYLVGGYIYTESEGYDITWTMPHCVLTLKMIALSFDLWDGQKLKESQPVSVNQKKTALYKPPTFINLVGFVYFPPAFLVGPIFSFKRYTYFINDCYPLDDPNATKERYSQGFRRMCIGFLYLMVHQIGGIKFNMDYMLTEEFAQSSIIYRHIYCGIWAQIALNKYISCWLLTEGACILCGLSYNGNEKDTHKWDGCSNIKISQFLGATKFQHYIDSFNCNTNYFAAEYIYKRLKFLGNRNLSQGATLFFLALWHGINSGYYATFLNEFIIIYVEKEFEDLFKKTILPDLAWFRSSYTEYLIFFMLKCYTVVFMGWSLAPFDLKISTKWLNLYSKLWFSGYILFLPWVFCYKPILKKILKKYDLYKQGDAKSN